MGTTETLPTDEVRLHLVRDATRRHWFSIVLITLMMTMGVFAYSHAGTASYTAYSRVLVRPTPGNALSEDVTTSTGQVTVAMQTEASLISSPEVTALANVTLDDDVSPGSPDVVATVPENTEIVQVAFTAGTARDAQRGAQAFAQAFLEYRTDLAQSTISYQSNNLQKQARTAAAKLKAAAQLASTSTPPPDAASQVQLYASRLAALQSSIGELETLDVRAGSLVTPARLPAAPNGISPLVLLVAAAMVGLGGGLALAVWRERGDDRIRSGSQIALHGVTVVARLPQGSQTELITHPSAATTMLEGYRQAAIGILAGVPRPAVLVVSALDDQTRAEGVAANIALSLRASGHQVMLVDASGDGSALGSLLDLSSEPGLREVLQDEADLDEVLQEVHRMRVLGAGMEGSGRRDLLPGAEMIDLLEKLRGETEYVVVAAPAAMTAAGTAMAVSGDSLLLVGTERHSTNQDLMEVAQRSRQLGVDLLGLVLTVPTARTHQDSATSSTGLASDLEDHLRVVFPAPLRLSKPRRLSRSRRGATDYLLLPSARNPKLMVPSGPRRATVSAIRHYRPATTTGDRVRRATAVLCVRAGIGRLLFGRVRITAPAGERSASLIDHLSESLGQPVSFGLHLGPPRAVRKPVLHLMGDDGHTLAFAKVGATPFTRQLVRHETGALELLSTHTFDHLVLPPVLDYSQWRGHEVLVLGALTGTRSAPLDPAALGAAMSELARSISITATPLGASSYWTGVVQRLEALPDSPVRRRLRTAADTVASAHAHQTLQYGSWHGDWTPWNMTTDGQLALVWDWEKFELDVPIGFDAVHCAVQGAVVLSGLTPTSAFEQTRDRAAELLAPFHLDQRRAQLVVTLYAIEISIRYLQDAESEVGTTPMTRVSEWLPGVLDDGLARP